MREIKINEKGQAVAPQSITITANAFNPDDTTQIYWLGSAGIMIHSHSCNIMIDPVLKGFDMPLLYEMPILTEQIDNLDAVLITHIDNDHYSRLTCNDIKDKVKAFYAPNYVADVMNAEGFPTIKKDINETFKIHDIQIQLTPAWHNWQNDSKKYSYRHWDMRDYCGYELKTQDGTIWLPGDSRLLPDHLQMDNPDVILFDFADNPWHIGFEGAVKLANTYPTAQLICIHWGSVDAPAMTPFNGNPLRLLSHVINPQRIIVLAPGEAYHL